MRRRNNIRQEKTHVLRRGNLFRGARWHAANKKIEKTFDFSFCSSALRPRDERSDKLAGQTSAVFKTASLTASNIVETM